MNPLAWMNPWDYMAVAIVLVLVVWGSVDTWRHRGTKGT